MIFTQLFVLFVTFVYVKGESEENAFNWHWDNKNDTTRSCMVYSRYFVGLGTSGNANGYPISGPTTYSRTSNICECQPISLMPGDWPSTSGNAAYNQCPVMKMYHRSPNADNFTAAWFRGLTSNFYDVGNCTSSIVWDRGSCNSASARCKCSFPADTYRYYLDETLRNAQCYESQCMEYGMEYKNISENVTTKVPNSYGWERRGGWSANPSTGAQLDAFLMDDCKFSTKLRCATGGDNNETKAETSFGVNNPINSKSRGFCMYESFKYVTKELKSGICLNFTGFNTLGKGNDATGYLRSYGQTWDNDLSYANRQSNVAKYIPSFLYNKKNLTSVSGCAQSAVNMEYYNYDCKGKVFVSGNFTFDYKYYFCNTKPMCNNKTHAMLEKTCTNNPDLGRLLEYYLVQNNGNIGLPWYTKHYSGNAARVKELAGRQFCATFVRTASPKMDACDYLWRRYYMYKGECDTLKFITRNLDPMDKWQKDMIVKAEVIYNTTMYTRNKDFMMYESFRSTFGTMHGCKVPKFKCDPNALKTGIYGEM